jgi:DNA-binding MarR family transcriptional regulator
MVLDSGPSCDKLFRIFARWVGEVLVARTLELAGDGVLTTAQYHCLTMVAGREPCAVGRLAEGLGVSDPAATKVVSRLEGKGLVARTGWGADRRVVHVTLSQRGRSVMTRLERRRSELLEAVLTGFPARKLQQLAHGLEGLLLSALDSPEIIERVCLHCDGTHSGDCVVSRAYALVCGAEIPWVGVKLP